MNILILQGPNLNLLGHKGPQNNSRMTLDKLNRELKKFSRTNNVEVKIFQTHKQFQAVNILQRNRNWATGILFIPTSWARNDYTILETIKLINLKMAIIYFNKEFSFGTNAEDSIMVSENIKDFTGSPLDACIKGMEYLIT